MITISLGVVVPCVYILRWKQKHLDWLIKYHRQAKSAIIKEGGNSTLCMFSWGKNTYARTWELRGGGAYSRDNAVHVHRTWALVCGRVSQKCIKINGWNLLFIHHHDCRGKFQQLMASLSVSWVCHMTELIHLDVDVVHNIIIPLL